MKKLNAKNNGITLISLVITIILLIILARISIVQLTNSGLLTKANEAKEKYKNMQEKEDVALIYYENKINEYISNSRNENEENLNSMFYPNKSMELTIVDNEVTIPRNGWLYMKFFKSTYGEMYAAYRNDMEVFVVACHAVNTTDSAYIPVKEGDIIKIAGSSSSSYFSFTLMYYEK